MIDNTYTDVLFNAKLLLESYLSCAAKDNKLHSFICFNDCKSTIILDGGNERTPSEGTICYIAPNVGYKITGTGGISGIACSGTLADSFAKLCQASDFHISLRPNAIDTYSKISEILESNDEKDIESINRCAMLFYKLFIEMVFSQSHIVESKPAFIAQSIKDYIDSNIKTDISVTSIAKQFYLSETHVIRVFRDKFGITPKQYILKVKIDASKQLLLYTGYQIKEIAMIFHFADSYHFSHTFKRFTGLSPEKFRMCGDERIKK